MDNNFILWKVGRRYRNEPFGFNISLFELACTFVITISISLGSDSKPSWPESVEDLFGLWCVDGSLKSHETYPNQCPQERFPLQPKHPLSLPILSLRPPEL